MVSLRSTSSHFWVVSATLRNLIMPADFSAGEKMSPGIEFFGKVSPGKLLTPVVLCLEQYTNPNG